MYSNKKILFISSTHGNENFSIQVFTELEKEYSKERYNYDWIIGNPKAVEKNVRFIESDLNRSAPGNSKSETYEIRRAAEIIELSKQYAMIIDVHGTESDFGIVKIIPYPSFANLVLAAMIPLQHNVIWYSQKSVVQGSLVQFTHCPALELECGDKNDIKTAKYLKNTLKAFLENMKNPQDIISQLKQQELYQVYGKEIDSSRVVSDFKKVTFGQEEYYPFLTKNGYKNIAYYKMKKIQLEELFSDRNQTK